MRNNVFPSGHKPYAARGNARRIPIVALGLRRGGFVWRYTFRHALPSSFVILNSQFVTLVLRAHHERRGHPTLITCPVIAEWISAIARALDPFNSTPLISRTGSAASTLRHRLAATETMSSDHWPGPLATLRSGHCSTVRLPSKSPESRCGTVGSVGKPGFRSPPQSGASVFRLRRIGRQRRRPLQRFSDRA